MKVNITAVKKFLKPGVLKISIFLAIAAFFTYFTKENACGVSIFFAFCYKAYGFPFLHIVSGQIDSASGYIATLPLGAYFSKYGNFLFNPITLVLDIILLYLLACLISILFGKMNIKH